MQLSLMTWLEVEERISTGACVMLPLGSIEQHGPIGLIGTDTVCAHEVALAAAKLCSAIVAPPVAYAPAPFNTAFPGTVSITSDLFSELLHQVCHGLLAQGFRGVFIVNGHGANLEPAHTVAGRFDEGAIHIQSWWDPKPVAAVRNTMFGDWEGMHATPSEVAITQALHGAKVHPTANKPPEKLSPAFMKAHAGDKHGPPDEHRAQFPDGRVGSHSALATPDKGRTILDTAAEALARDFKAFSASRASTTS